MARPTIENIRSIADYQTVYHWNITINKPSGVAFPTANELNFRCTTTALPVLSSNNVSAKVRGHIVYMPGLAEYNGPLALAFIEGVDDKIRQWIHDWREACWQVNTGVQITKAQVETTIYMIQLDRQDNPTWTYHLIGCFLESYTMPELTAETGLWNPTLNIRYDYFTESAK